MQGAALHWYLNKVQATPNNQQIFTSCDDFMTQLRAAFKPPNYQQHLRRQLKQLKQTGSVHEYGAQFRNLIGQITDIAELDKVTYFVEGLKHATKMEVNYRVPGNFEDAWKLAINYDTAMFGQGKSGKGTSSSSLLRKFPPHNIYKNNNYNYNNQQTNQSIPIELDQVESYNKGKFNNKGKGKQIPKVDCYHCGKTGNYAKECRAPQPKAKITSIEEQNNNIELTYLEDNKERLLKFKGKVNGIPALILLDSGASQNYIDKKFVN